MELLVDIVYHCVIAVDSHRPKQLAIDSREWQPTTVQHSHDNAAAVYGVWRVLIGRLISHPGPSRAHVPHGDVLAKDRAIHSSPRSPLSR